MKHFRGTQAIAYNFVGTNLQPIFYPLEKEYGYMMGDPINFEGMLYFEGKTWHSEDFGGIIATGECCWLN